MGHIFRDQGRVEHNAYLPDPSSDSKESRSRVPESICSDSRESGPKACFFGGEPMLVPESTAGIFIVATDGWWPSGEERCEENEFAMIFALTC